MAALASSMKEVASVGKGAVQRHGEGTTNTAQRLDTGRVASATRRRIHVDTAHLLQAVGRRLMANRHRGERVQLVVRGVAQAC